MIIAETRHRMTRRLRDWDYTQRAIYMVTVTLAERRHEWLGRLTNLAKNGEAQNWVVTPTPFGEAVLEALAEMPRLYPQVRIIAQQLMPEHFHFIAYVTAPLPKPLGELVRGFKAGAAKRWKSLADNLADNLAKNGEAQNWAQNCSVPGHSCPGSRPGFPIWAAGFQDTILFREGQLAGEIAYLHDNPRRLAEKRANPELFHRVARLALPLDGGRLTGQFEALGNRHLLERPLHQVQCSRHFFAYCRVPKPGGGLKIKRDAAGEPLVARTTPDYEERLAAALAAAAHGAVVLSPCISDGERQIAREAQKRGLPLIALQNMGFAPLQKPTGRLFDACADGRLLLLAPGAWPYSTQPREMTRFDATALNRIAQWLAGEDALEINYHGMRPANIDELAMRAVRAGNLAENLAKNGEAQNYLAKNGEAQNWAQNCSVPGHSCPGLPSSQRDPQP